MNEELLIKMGLDSSAVATGIRGVKGQLEAFGEGIKSTFSEVGSHIGAAFGVGAAIVTLEKALDRAREIKRVSEDLGVSTNFVQDLQNVGAAAGVSAEKIEKMMSHFVKGLQTGEDPEEAFNKWADAIAKIEDPVTRVRMAMEAFNKGGDKMLAIAGQGSKAMKEMGDSFAKFSRDDIAGLEHAKSSLEQIGNALVVAAGKSLLFFKSMSGVVGNVLAGSTIKDAIAAQMREELSASAQMDKNEAAVKLAEKKEKSLSDAEDLYESQYKMDEMWIKILDKQIKRAEEIKRKQQQEQQILDDASGRAINTYRAIIDAEQKQVGFTLEELAGRRRYSRRDDILFGNGEIGPPGSKDAQDVITLRGWARENAIRGNVDLARKQASQANDIFDKLTKSNPFLIDPLEHLKRQAEHQTAHLQILSDRAAGKGGALMMEPIQGD